MFPNIQPSASPDVPGASLPFAAANPPASLFASFLEADGAANLDLPAQAAPHSQENASMPDNTAEFPKPNPITPAPATVAKNKTLETKSGVTPPLRAQLPSPLPTPIIVPLVVDPLPVAQNIAAPREPADPGNMADAANSHSRTLGAVTLAANLRGPLFQNSLPQIPGSTAPTGVPNQPATARPISSGIKASALSTLSNHPNQPEISGSEEHLGTTDATTQRAECKSAPVTESHLQSQAFALRVERSKEACAECTPDIGHSMDERSACSVASVPKQGPADPNPGQNAAAALPNNNLGTDLAEEDAGQTSSRETANSPAIPTVSVSAPQLTTAISSIQTSKPISLTTSAATQPTSQSRKQALTTTFSHIAAPPQNTTAASPASHSAAHSYMDKDQLSSARGQSGGRAPSDDLKVQFKNPEAQLSSSEKTAHSKKSGTASTSGDAKAESKPAQPVKADANNSDTPQMPGEQANATAPASSAMPAAVDHGTNLPHNAAPAQSNLASANSSPIIPSSSAKTEPAAVPAAKSLDEARPETSAPVQAVRIFQSVNQSEMHVGLRTESFGALQVRTTISGKSVEVTLGSERGDLKSFFASELPNLQSSLQQHDLRLQQLRTIVPAYSPQSGTFAGSDRQPQHSREQRHAPEVSQLSSTSSEQSETLVEVTAGLSIRI